jgi:REP-associated tyrosine transposase
LYQFGNIRSSILLNPHELRYVELNPVRARMVKAAEQWPWSSAGAHCGTVSPNPILAMERWRGRWTSAEWCQFLRLSESPPEMSKLRRSTHTGRPLGTPQFVAALEKSTSRRLMPGKAGRRKSALDAPHTIAVFT